MKPASDLSASQRLFWFVRAIHDGRDRNLAVAAMSADSAKRQTWRRFKGAKVTSVEPVQYSHAWLIDHRI